MSTKKWRRSIGVKKCGYGCFLVEINYRGKTYSCTSNNSLAYDRVTDCEEDKKIKKSGYTLEQAWDALYRECKKKNGLR